MTNYTGPISAERPPASSPRIIPPGMRRLAAGAWLAVALVLAAGAASASASAGGSPYSITEIGRAPATGFSISDIGAVPTHSPDTTDLPASAVEVGDINSG